MLQLCRIVIEGKIKGLHRHLVTGLLQHLPHIRRRSIVPRCPRCPQAVVRLGDFLKLGQVSSHPLNRHGLTEGASIDGAKRDGHLSLWGSYIRRAFFRRVIIPVGQRTGALARLLALVYVASSTPGRRITPAQVQGTPAQGQEEDKNEQDDTAPSKGAKSGSYNFIIHFLFSPSLGLREPGQPNYKEDWSGLVFGAECRWGIPMPHR